MRIEIEGSGVESSSGPGVPVPDVPSGTPPPSDTSLRVYEPRDDVRGDVSRQHRERLTAVLSPVLVLVLWEAASRTGVLDTRFFPAPTAVVTKMVELTVSGELVENVAISLRRLGIGYVVGLVPALLLGLVAGLSRWVRVAVMPLIDATFPIPKSAIAPLLLLIFGFGEASKWMLVSIGVFFPVFYNTLSGVINIEGLYLDVARNYGARRRWQVIRTVALPGAMPTIVTGFRLGLGMAFILIVIAEMLGAQEGLGYMLVHSWTLFQVTTMYSALIAIAILGIVLQFLLTMVEKRLVPWKADQ